MRKIGKSKIVAYLLAAIMLVNVVYTTVPTNAVENDGWTEQEENQIEEQAEEQNQNQEEDLTTDQIEIQTEDQNQEEDIRVLECPLEIHHHDTDCYDQDNKLICGQADFVVHTHDANCYDSDGTLVCTLPEIKVHKHEDSCYTESKVLVCGQEDASEHTHTDACYQTEQVLSCGIEESEGHTHSADCYEQVLTCTIPESEEHTHTDDCYQDQLTCTIPESAGHTHTESCYTEEKTLICSPHIHTDACYEVNRTPVCGKEEIVLHTHQPSCYDENGERICDKTEVLEHQHTDACFKTETAAEDDETESETETEPTQETLDPELIQKLNSAILEAVQKDANLWNYLLTAMYGEDQESIEMLAEQFEVETEVMQQYVQELGSVFNKMYDAMDEDEEDTLWEELMSAKEDEEHMSALAERFGVDEGMLMLFIEYTLSSYEPELLATSKVTTNTPEYSLMVNGQDYVAFSLNKAKTRTAGINYKLVATGKNGTSSWFQSGLTKQYSSKDYLISTIAFCASFYNDSSWVADAKSTFGCSSDAEAKTILRAVIQQVIWYFTNYYTDSSYSDISSNSTMYNFAKKLEDKAYWSSDAGKWPSTFNWNWYEPTSTGYNSWISVSNSPKLLVATTEGEKSSDGMYVGYYGTAARSENNVNTPYLYITTYDDYVNAASTEERIAKSQIAYCYNNSLHYPFSDQNGGWAETNEKGYYNLYAETTDPNFASDQAMAIALNGYPHNASGFYTGQVSEQAFYVLTQYAIWYFGEGSDFVNSYQMSWSTDELALLNKLIGTDLTTTLQNIKNKNGNPDTVESYIDLYRSMRQAYNSQTGEYVSNTSDTTHYYSDKGYQNLLTVGYISQAYNLPDGTLTVSKTVAGNVPINEALSDFSFEVVFQQDGAAYTGNISVVVTRLNAKATETETWKPDSTGKITFTLKGGENVTMTLPAGVTYTVTEKDIPEDYEQTSPKGSATGRIESAANKTAAFTNTYVDKATDGTLTVSKTVVRASTGAAVTSTSTDMPDVEFTFEASFTKDGKAYTDEISYEKGSQVGKLTPKDGKVTFTLKNSESLTMTLPIGVAYTVTELTDSMSMPVDFALKTASDSTGTIAGGTDAQASFTNTFADVITISGTKTWQGDTASDRPSTTGITLQLWKHLEGTSESEDAMVNSTDPGWSGFDGSFTVKPDSSGNWTYRFSNKPKYEDGKLVTYYVKEPNPPEGYTAELHGMDITNIKTGFNLTLEKVVTGSYADLSKAFAFTITLKDEEGNNVSGSFDVETSKGVTSTSIANKEITFTDGKAHVNLANEQQIKILALPQGYTYEIQETLAGNEFYKKSISVNDTAVSGQSEGNTGERTINSDETVVYTNASQDNIPPTGMNTNLLPHAMFLALMVLLGGLACAIGLMRRKER
jgi:TQXA domain-containing protein